MHLVVATLAYLHKAVATQAPHPLVVVTQGRHHKEAATREHLLRRPVATQDSGLPRQVATIRSRATVLNSRDTAALLVDTAEWILKLLSGSMLLIRTGS